MNTIFVTGDWVADWNLARPANLPEGYFDGSQQTQLYCRAGGAWYVAHLIERVACRDLTAATLTVKALRPQAEFAPGMENNGRPKADLAHAYSVWWKHQRLNSGKEDDQVWRIARFAGCQKSKWKPLPAAGTIQRASLLVVDDLGLGFSDQPEAVAHVTSHAIEKTPILVKHGLRPDGSGLLPQLLQEKLSERLHVVASANALRRRHAALSSVLSWDQVLEDIEREFKSGPSSRDLARCASVVVHFGLAGAAVFYHGDLHRFIFLPDEMERAWEDERPGNHFGTGSVLTACLARHLIAPEEYPIFFAVTQALAAQRRAHHGGAGTGVELDIDLPYGPRESAADPAKNPAAACIAPPQENDKPDAKHLADIKDFRAAWNPNKIIVWPEPSAEGLRRSRLLSNVTGTSPEALRAKAVEVVIQGPKQALASAPKATYGKYLTVDRDEIESINEIRRLILEYKANPKDKRPLSFAVFGAPGSGKSFAVKQLAETLFGKVKEPLEFNLTQIKAPLDLHRAFHQVRDASIRLEIPLVFWDEFDTAGLQWLADFLAPMQDAEFFDGSHKHPFGKCIFVFAGGTSDRFEKFKEWQDHGRESSRVKTQDDAWHPTFCAVKGPDFISRLRGFINVKGPNPTQPSVSRTKQSAPESDPAFVLRRALVLRADLERLFPDLIHPESKRAAIAPNVLHAFLSAERYEHGARSIGALVAMSALAGAKAFTVSALPSEELRELHVSGDFSDHLNAPVWTEELLLALAQAGWLGWKHQKPFSVDVVETTAHRDLVGEWNQLDPRAKMDNTDPVPRRLLELNQLGCAFVPHSGDSDCPPLDAAEKDALIEKLIDPEHRIWLSRRLVEGWEHAA
ncbi:MAG TPA: hypothetical protein DCE44_20555 [Verrucomicrobiales bacterium]|nr:hypothetical protein [Verrucomicrobiales bacterium]